MNIMPFDIYSIELAMGPVVGRRFAIRRMFII
jgi:hypothetical protein